MKNAVRVLLLVFLASNLSVTTSQAQRPQPGAAQGGPTTGEEMMPLFDMRYFIGEWVQAQGSHASGGVQGVPLGPGLD